MLKKLTMYKNNRCSLQYHNKRSEHWTVVEGIGKVINDDKEYKVEANESIYVQLGAKHRLENVGVYPLKLIEVQYGDYIGEDDIVRLQDDFGRK